MKKKKPIRQLFRWLIALPVTLILVVTLIFYFNQDQIVQSRLKAMNETFHGELEVGDSHLALFENFPYISLIIDDVKVKEHKTEDSPIILDVADIYIGFNFWDVLTGNFDIKSLIIENGVIDIVLHEDGTTNIMNALALSGNTAEPDEEAFNIHLQKITLNQIEFHQKEEATQTDISTRLNFAKGGFKTEGSTINAHVDTEFVLDLIQAGDTSFFNDKHFEFHTDVHYDQSTGLMSFEPSGITMEHGDFEMKGKIDTKNNMDLDLEVKGTKPNFDMIIAFAPTELIPLLERYRNAGNIYFNAVVKGPTTNGRQPFIDAQFGASEAFLENIEAQKKIDNMGFSGHFTNGAQRNLNTMEFSIENISATLEQGKVDASISVINFEEPDIEMSVDADFDLEFWAEFLNLDQVEALKGDVEMHMKFHDIIDIDAPEKTLEELNQAYYAELKVQDFSFNSEDLPAPLHDLDLHIEMNGKKAHLDQFDMILGQSNLSLEGFLSDLPAIVHHSPTPVEAHLDIRSEQIDIAELTHFSAEDSTGVNEQIKDLSLGFSFKALGNAFTEYKHLPLGEFFIDNLFADLQHYPHTLHDFHADIMIKEDNLNIIDFTGNIDETDFHFNGLVKDYSFWMQEELTGEVGMDITLKSDLFRLNDVFTYQGVNYVPEDYRHEEIEKLVLHLGAEMVYDSSQLNAINIQLDQWTGKMHVHPLRFEDFSGNFHWENEHFTVTDFKGKMGDTDLQIDLAYFLGNDENIAQKDNYFVLKSDKINFDQLFNFTPSAVSSDASQMAHTTEDSEAHAAAFNIFEVPFTNMHFEVDIQHLLYHRYDLKNFKMEMRTTQDHHIYLDTFYLDAADGSMAMQAHLNGSDPDHIYIEPKMHIEHMDLDQLLFKFENFGQDHLVSENVHGELTVDIWGNVRIYPDLTPDLDQSEIHLDALVLNGRLENYEPMLMMSDYFGNKNLNNVRFDTIANHMDLTQGTLTIPNMTIESTLGHLEVSGSQNMNDSINYYVKIPWSLVREAAKNKLFGASKKSDQTEDEILEVDPNKKTKYLNVNITGTTEDFNIRLKKEKKK